MSKKVNIARYRNIPYIVNFPSGMGTLRYEWAGSKGTIYDVKEVPEEVVNWLILNSNCFKEGELVIVDNNENAKALINQIDQKDEYEKNTHSRDEIEKILKGNFMKMKSTLNDITNTTEKQFVISVAKDIGLDSVGKLKFLAEWMGVDFDLLFGNE